MIIAIKDEEKVTFGFSYNDTLCDVSIYLQNDNSPENLSFKRVNKNTIVGFTSINRQSDLILNSEECFKEAITYDELINNEIPLMKDLIQNDGYENEDSFKNSVLIGIGNKLYKITPGLVALSINDYAISGFTSLTDVALGILENSKELDQESRILKAYSLVNEAAKINLFPVYLVDNKKNVVKVVEERIKKGEKTYEYTSRMRLQEKQ